MKKRFLAGFLSLALCLGMMPATAFAETESTAPAVASEAAAEAAIDANAEETASEAAAEETATEVAAAEETTDANETELDAEAPATTDQEATEPEEAILKEKELPVEEGVTEAPSLAVNHSQAEAVAWARARAAEGWLVDWDGRYGCQCVDLILAYYNYLLGWNTSGNAIDYATGENYNVLPSGWKRVYSNPQPGDVVVWNRGATLGWDEYYGFNTYADSVNGHIGIVTGVNADGTYSTVETNADYKVNIDWGLDPKRKAKTFGARYTGGVACYIRPDFPQTPERAVTSYGSFDATIRRSSDDTVVTAADAQFDCISLSGNRTGDARQDWHFELQSDNTYIIRSYLNGNVLDVGNADSTDGNAIGTYTQWGEDNGAQRWYLCWSTGGYCLVPKLNTSKCLTFNSSGKPVIGTWTDAQNQIITFDVLQYKGPTELSISGLDSADVGEYIHYYVNYGNATDKKGVTWTSDDPSIASIDEDGFIYPKKEGTVVITATSTYNYLLNASKVLTVTQNHVYEITERVDASCELEGRITYTCKDCNDSYTETLPALGHDYQGKLILPTTTTDGYTLNVCSRCKDSYTSNPIPALEVDEDGYVYSDLLPNYVDPYNFEIECQNHYEVIADTAPGADWTFVETVEDGWKNVGSEYSSVAELPTSDERVLLYYYYFHFCGPNTGNRGNYEYTSSYIHWDSVNINQITGARIVEYDGSLPVYLLTYNGSDLYCQTGITCDGSYGTHGGRCKAWYRMNVYQDRQRILKNKYAKDSGYVAEADPDATSVTYRFKPINNGPEITSQPVNVTAGRGTKVAFSISATGEGLTYQWQYSKDGVKWYNSSASTAKTTSVSVTVSTSNYTNIYRCRVTSSDGTVIYSETAGVDMIPWVTITQQPESPAMIVGETVNFHVEAENVASYQWQYSKDGTSWYKSGVTGSTTDTLSIKVSKTNMANMYRCQMTGIDGYKVSSNAAVFVIIAEQPSPSKAKVGEYATFTLNAEGVTAYQWQYSDNGTKWYNSTASTAQTETIRFKATSTNRDRVYRCRLTTVSGTYAYTKPVGFAKGATILEQPGDPIANIGQVAQFTVLAEHAEAYQWQYSKDGKNWYKSSASTATSSTLKITVSATNEENWYRCKVTGEDGSVVYTEKAHAVA